MNSPENSHRDKGYTATQLEQQAIGIEEIQNNYGVLGRTAENLNDVIVRKRKLAEKLRLG